MDRVVKKSGAAAVVFFASFLDTKKEVGCGARPHCYAKIIMNHKINLSQKTNLEASEAALRA